MRLKELKVLSLIVLVLTLAVVAGSNGTSKPEIKWKPLIPRLTGPKYQLPQGWKEAVKGVDYLTRFNAGSIKFDPATVKNDKIFEKLTGIKIKYVTVTRDERLPKYATLLRGKSSAVDVLFTEWVLNDYGPTGALEPIDELWSKELAKTYASLDILNMIMRSEGPDGKLHWYGVPEYGRFLGLFYRTDLLKKYGYEHPPTSWDELVKQAKDYTADLDGDGTIDRWGIVYPGGEWMGAHISWMALLKANGGSIVTPAGIKLNTKAGIKACQFLADLRNKYKVAPPGVVAFKEVDAADAFTGGKAAMSLMPGFVWYRASSPKYSKIVGKFNWTYTPTLTGAPLKGAYYQGGRLSINHWSQKKQAAKLYLDFMRSTQAHINQLIDEGNSVLNMNAYKSKEVQKKIPHLAKIKKGFVEKASVNEPPHILAIQEISGRYILKAISGEMNPEKALNEAQKELARTYPKQAAPVS